MNEHTVPVPIEVLSIHNEQMAAVTVPAGSDAVERWPRVLQANAAAAGLETNFEYRGSGDDSDLVAVAVGPRSAHDSAPSALAGRPGRWVRIRIQLNEATDTELITLPFPQAVIRTACDQLGIDPAAPLPETPQPPTMVEPASDRLAAMHAAALDTARQDVPLHFEDFDAAADYLIGPALSAVRATQPSAGISVVRGRWPPGPQPLRILVTLPPDECDRCGIYSEGFAPAEPGHWACRTCRGPAALRRLAALSISADEPDAQHPRGLTLPGPATLTAMTQLGAHAYHALRDTYAAADAWDLAFEIAEELEDRTPADGSVAGDELLRNWVDDAYAYQDLRTDYGDAGRGDLEGLRAYRPLAMWSPSRGELWIGHADAQPASTIQPPRIVARIDAESVAHPGSAVHVALAAAARLRDQLPRTSADFPENPPVLWSPHNTADPLSTLIVEPDATQLDGALQPLADAPLGTIADAEEPDGRNWAPIEPIEPPQTYETLAAF